MSEKETALKSMEAGFGGLLQAIEGLDNEQLTRPGLDGWSVKDILAHVLGWERIETLFLSRMAAGERPNPDGIDYINEVDSWNASFVGGMVAISPQTVIAILRQAHMNHVIAARSLPDERLSEGKTARRLIDDDVRHYQEHAQQIRTWREREAS